MIHDQRHYWITTCFVLVSLSFRTTRSESTASRHADDLQNMDRGFAHSKLRSRFNSFDDLSQASQYFKGNNRRPEAVSSPRADHFNEHNRGFYSVVIPREKPMPSSIQLRSDRTNSGSDDGSTILRPLEATADKKFLVPPLKSKYRRLSSDGAWSSRNTGTNSPPNRPSSYALEENPQRNSQRVSDQRSHTDNILHIIARETHKHWRSKPVTGLLYGKKSPQYCPRLAVTTSTIVRCSKGRKLGSKCHLSCARGFALVGKRKTRRCRRRHRGKRRKHQENSTPHWSGKQEDFQCVPACKDLGVPENGERTCRLIDHAGGRARRCTTTCKAGYEVVGTPQNTCAQSGRWSGQPAVCKVASATRHRPTPKIPFKFREHQRLPCGEVYSLASFRKNGTVYLIAGDKNGEEVKIFQWGDGKFNASAYQTFHYPSVEVVEVLTAPDGTIWLLVGGGVPVTMYRMDADGRFHRSHTTELFGAKSTIGDTINFAELGGEFYRCYGRNRRETPVIIVQKIRSGRDVFQRIMRKKLPGEKVHQCSMYTEDGSLYTVATLNRPTGEGRIMIGYLTERRMKVVDVIAGKRLQRITDSFGFSVDGDRYMAVSQGLDNGECLIYKRHWRKRPPGETG